jgi:NAD(P)-dependent dehydrogenase (short-subunit alcohol dehydrogenase family)
MTNNLQGKVCVVTGASRSVGQAIAAELGARGATVYVTGRSVRGAATGKFEGDTVDDTAALVTQRGGKGIAVALDQRDDGQVQALFARVQAEQGRLDLLVNNAWAGYEGYDDTFSAPFWQQPLDRWDRMLSVGVRSTYVASYFAAPILVEQGRGLIVNTSVLTRPDKYLGTAPYDTAKTAINRLTYTTAQDLAQHGVSVVGLAPGWLRTKILYEMYKTDAEHWQDVPDLAQTESTAFAARAVAALAQDAQAARWNGQTVSAAQLARLYGFTDIDGRQPDFYRDVMGMETELVQE